MATIDLPFFEIYKRGCSTLKALPHPYYNLITPIERGLPYLPPGDVITPIERGFPYLTPGDVMDSSFGQTLGIHHPYSGFLNTLFISSDNTTQVCQGFPGHM